MARFFPRGALPKSVKSQREIKKLGDIRSIEDAELAGEIKFRNFRVVQDTGNSGDLILCYFGRLCWPFQCRDQPSTATTETPSTF
jgi:hypothetical protein